MSDAGAREDGRLRCGWPGGDPEYVRYHDEEWGRPVRSDDRLFEKLCLEGFQAGLSWLTILRKRPRFREVFHDFAIPGVAAMGEPDVQHLLQDAGIIRHRGKIEATIGNARCALELIAAEGSLADFVWRFRPPPREGANSRETIPTQTAESSALSKALKKRGWRFVGPTTCYAFMQAMGLVNDHVEGCFVRPEVEAAQSAQSIARVASCASGGGGTVGPAKV